MNLPIDIPSGGPGINVDLFAGGGKKKVIKTTTYMQLEAHDGK